MLVTAALTTCVLAVVGGLRFLPTASEASPTASVGATADRVEPFSLAPEDLAAEDAAVSRSADDRAKARKKQPKAQEQQNDGSSEETLPPDSGSGRRVVFSEGLQRVWMIGADDEVERTYPVSGSIYDNLFPGTYEVYSRSRYAVGIDDSGTMEYFVRFTKGTNGGAIGFHTIPIDDGARVQTIGELGTPLSHGCIRQATSDAVAMWEFAPIGTTVVVTP